MLGRKGTNKYILSWLCMNHSVSAALTEGRIMHFISLGAFSGEMMPAEIKDSTVCWSAGLFSRNKTIARAVSLSSIYGCIANESAGRAHKG